MLFFLPNWPQELSPHEKTYRRKYQVEEQFHYLQHNSNKSQSKWVGVYLLHNFETIPVIINLRQFDMFILDLQFT